VFDVKRFALHDEVELVKFSPLVGSKYDIVV
jgi:hypothetical protein